MKRNISYLLMMMPCMITLTLMSCGKSTGSMDEVDSIYTELSTDGSSLGNVRVDGQKLVSKGIIKSVTDIALYAELQERIVACDLKEGKMVKKGDVLIRLDDEDIRTQIEKARHEFEQAEYQYSEILIGQGYKREEFSRIPEAVRQLAMVKCNYRSSQLNLEIARKQIQKTAITAPSSGAVTNVTVHLFDRPSGEPVCHIIDPGHLKVVFHVLETELSKVKEGQNVIVTCVTYPNEPHKATVSNISVMVDENGMLKVEALIDDATHLLPGMTAIVNF